MLASDSGQAPLRHTRGPAESCFLPDLTRFTGSRCAGPDPRRLVRVVPLGGPSLEREFSPPDVGLGYRAPRAPRLARSTREATRRQVASTPLEGCESGRIGTLGKRVWGNSPWVRIPLPPPRGVLPGRRAFCAASRRRDDTYVRRRIRSRHGGRPSSTPAGLSITPTSMSRATPRGVSAEIVGRRARSGWGVSSQSRRAAWSAARCDRACAALFSASCSLTVRKLWISPRPTACALRFTPRRSSTEAARDMQRGARRWPFRATSRHERGLPPRRSLLTETRISTTSCRAPCGSVPSYRNASSASSWLSWARAAVSPYSPGRVIASTPSTSSKPGFLACSSSLRPRPHRPWGQFQDWLPLRASHVEIHDRLLSLTRSAGEQRAIAGPPTLDDRGRLRLGDASVSIPMHDRPLVASLVASYGYPVATTAFADASADGGSPVAVRLWQLSELVNALGLEIVAAPGNAAVLRPCTAHASRSASPPTRTAIATPPRKLGRRRTLPMHFRSGLLAPDLP